ncbi:MAG: NACHT domain-containing protein [Hormoscilla sp. SP5CHS1]|nr:NACHT domain-containing protein [Hormoscilla sp. SP5CHS1]
MQGCTQENFDRLQLGKVTEERISGIDAANKYPHMMVFGKPGAGKTTFLKYLAISCMGGEFQGARVPVFITLKNWASDSNKPKLLEFVSQELANCDVTNKETVELFNQGRVLLLLDGLDGVLKEDSHRVIRQIQDFSDRYRSNVIVVTCRIAAREYTFQGFTEVEVADFDDQQIKTFACK